MNRAARRQQQKQQQQHKTSVLKRQHALLQQLQASLAHGQYADVSRLLKGLPIIDIQLAELALLSATTLERFQQLPMALRYAHQGIAIDPARADIAVKLGQLYIKNGQAGESLDWHRRAVQLAPDSLQAWQAYNQTLGDIKINNADARLEQDLLKILSIHGLDHLFAHRVALQLIGYRPEWQAVLQDPEKHVTSPILTNPLVIQLLQTIQLANPEVEVALTQIRRQNLLGEATRQLASPPDFIISLAAQCFINEYVYYQTDTEQAALEKLRTTLEQKTAYSTADIPTLALFSCYAPLISLSNHALLITLAEDSQTTHPQWAFLVQRQVAEPLTELAIAKEIPSLTDITDTTSRKVQAMYEKTPYPRWDGLHISKAEPFEKVIRREIPCLAVEGSDTIPHTDTPDILIAGCGTGRHALYSAHQFQNASVTAIDLSRTSLSYGQRKVNELGVNNVTFYQGDLLNLGTISQRFDLIESTGVLHHLADPVAGWRGLLPLLRPNGIMAVGFYSHIARRHIRAVRDFIKQEGFDATPAGVRACRQALLSQFLKNRALPGKSSTATEPVINMGDFYTLSNVQDLLFHVQEHRYTALQLAEILEELNLEFLGMRLPQNRTSVQFKKMFPKDTFGLSLENWHSYEEQYPNTFIGMYQFWVRQKSAQR